MTPPLAAHATGWAGWVGAVTLVSAYAATSAGRIRSGDRSYQVMNVVGSVGLGAVAWAHHTWPSLALNTLWLLIGVATLRHAPGASRPHRPDLGSPIQSKEHHHVRPDPRSSDPARRRDGQRSRAQ